MATTTPIRKLPIGVQDFDILRSEGYLYVDKTALIYRLISTGAAYFLSRLKAFFADFPYELNEKTERHYQVVFYLVFKLMGQFSDVEVRSCKGRAEAALTQIDDKGYLIPYTADGRKLVKVGASFSAAERNIDRWIVQ